MKHIAIFYSSKEGQTARIAHQIASYMTQQSRLRISEFNVEELDHRIEWFPYDGVIVGGSIHLGEHSTRLKKFINNHRELLTSIPSAFYSVSLSAAGNPEEQQEARQMVDNLIKTTGWTPDYIETFAGALRYKRYNPIKRWIMKRKIQNAGKQDIDTHRNYEYTNWEKVRHFSDQYLTEQRI